MSALRWASGPTPNRADRTDGWCRTSGPNCGPGSWTPSMCWASAQPPAFADTGVAAIGMGLVSLRRTGSDRPVVVCADVPQPVEQPVGPQNR
jgi:hypothetical protein